MKATYIQNGIAGSIKGIPSQCVKALEEMYREGDFQACNLLANTQEMGELAKLDETHEVLGGFAMCLDDSIKPTFNCELGIATVTTYVPVKEDQEMILNNPHRGFQSDHEETAAHRFGGREEALEMPDVFAQIEDTEPLYEEISPTTNALDIMPINWKAPVEDEPTHNAASDDEVLDVMEMF